MNAIDGERTGARGVAEDHSGMVDGVASAAHEVGVVVVFVVGEVVMDAVVVRRIPQCDFGAVVCPESDEYQVDAV